MLFIEGVYVSGVLSLAVPFLPHLYPLFSLCHHCDYRDRNRDQKYPFFQPGAKDSARMFF